MHGYELVLDMSWQGMSWNGYELAGNLTSSLAVGHSTHQGIEYERALSQYYVSPFIRTFALPTAHFISYFRAFTFYTCPEKPVPIAKISAAYIEYTLPKISAIENISAL